ncbi:PIN domain-containing protein [uncultured Ruminococcus sp.]|uniref:PIN domain-containing protein n=1 Tax=uncultured Ruminococcus sp. TaxID=165186 RepID=UPI0025F3528D|nr:PIN domain-containing protein [uncultured Ruminococcus sp.]
MKIYLIDFENVKSKGLTGIDSLTEYDRVIIFYSENADTINFEMHQKVLISKAEVEYFKVHVGGKNALDFQLSTLLGYLVSKNYYSHIFVISNDKSFDFLHDFWHGKYIAASDCVVYRTKTIAQAINYAGGKKQVVEEENDTEVFASAETAEDNASETAVTAAEENAVKVPAVPEKPAPAAVEKPAAEKKPAASEKQETEKPAAEQFTEKRAPKPAQSPAPNKERPEKHEKKQEKADTADYEFTISAEELNALEASFSTYTVIKPSDISETKQAEVKAEKQPEVRPEKQAEQPTAEKAKPKPVKEFYPALKETLKKTGLKPTEINHISQLLINSDTKEEFHNALAKDYKQDATELYKLLRPKYLRLKEMYAAEHPEYVSPDIVAVKAAVPAKAEDKPAETTENPAETTDKPAEQTAEIQEQPVTAKEEPFPAETVEEQPVEEEKAPEEQPVEEEKAPEEKAAEEKAPEEKPADEKPAEEKPAEKKPAKAKRSTAKKAEKSAKTDAEKPAKAKKTAAKKSEKSEKASTKKSAKAEKAVEIPAAGGDRLAELLDDKCSTEEIELIRQLFREVPSRQQLYIRMIKQFGKKNGCVYYNAIKPEYEALSEAIK